jgi:hypothetical protein
MLRKPQQTTLLQEQLQPASHLQQQALSSQAALQAAQKVLQGRLLLLVQAVQRRTRWSMLYSC